MIRLIVLLPALAATACAGLPNHHRFEPVAPAAVAVAPAARPASGAIYSPGAGLRLFEDRTARRVGDVLTVRLVESTRASKRASTSINKESEVGLLNPTLLGQPLRLLGGEYNLGAELEGSREVGGSGQSDQSNSLNGEITALVVDVHANGNLVIQGEKLLLLNQGKEFVKISGVVRADDIAADNSVLSTQVADARITYAGRGAIADANAAGWLARFFLTALWPF